MAVCCAIDAEFRFQVSVLPPAKHTAGQIERNL